MIKSIGTIISSLASSAKTLASKAGDFFGDMDLQMEIEMMDLDDAWWKEMFK